MFNIFVFGHLRPAYFGVLGGCSALQQQLLFTTGWVCFFQCYLDLSYMRARARGRVAISSPVVLHPVPASTFRCGGRELIIFSCGFFTAIVWILWVISE